MHSSSALPGYPQQSGYQQQPSPSPYSEAEKLVKRKASIEAGLAVLDEHLSKLLGLLRPKFVSSLEAALENRQRDKARHTLMASGVLFGTFLQNAAANYADAEITTGDIIQRSGNAVSAASYAGDRVIRIKPQELTCSPHDLDHVLAEYSILTDLDGTYRTYVDGGYGYAASPSAAIPKDATPKALEFTADFFGIELRDAVSCVILEGSVGNGVNLIIGDVVGAVKKRLRLAQKWLDCLDKMAEIQGYGLNQPAYGQEDLTNYIERNGQSHPLDVYRPYQFVY